MALVKYLLILYGVSDSDEFYASTNMVSMFTNYYATTIAYDSTEKAIKLTASASNDPGVFFNAKSSSLASSSYKYIVVTYKTSKNASSQLFLQTSDRPSPSADFKVTYSTQYDNKYHSQIIDLTSNTSWTGTIYGFRFDYFGTSNANDVIYIDSIVFCKSQEDANYIKWERENVKNNPGVFVACEEMVRLFSDFHMCSAKYDSTEEAIVLTVESNVCKQTSLNGSHITGNWTCAPGFDTMVDFSVPSGLTSEHKYLVITYMTPSDLNTIIGVDHQGNTLQTLEGFNGGIPISIYPQTASGGENEKYQRRFKIYDSNVYYSDYVNLEDETYGPSTIKKIRIDPFNLHYTTPGSKLYISSIMFCKTIDEANEIIGSQLDDKYPYNYELYYDSNTSDDSVTEMPQSISIVRSANSTHTFNISEDEPTRGKYIFAGWSEMSNGTVIDNMECEMIGIKGETVTKTLYAIWRENSDYIVYIPSTLKIEGGNRISFNISADIEYFVDSASISIVVNGIKKFVLEENNEITLDYEIRDSSSKNIYENNDVITTFSPNDSSDKKFEIEIMEDARYSGNYNEILNFTVNYSSGT